MSYSCGVVPHPSIACRKRMLYITYFKAKFLFDSSYVPQPGFHSGFFGSDLKNVLCDSKQA